MYNNIILQYNKKNLNIHAFNYLVIQTKSLIPINRGEAKLTDYQPVVWLEFKLSTYGLKVVTLPT